MTQINPRAEITVVPVGIDASLYAFIPDDRRSARADAHADRHRWTGIPAIRRPSGS